MNRFYAGVTIVMCLFSGSCAEKIQRYVDSPRTLLEDPVSVENQNALDELEGRYLRKEISYAQYLEQKKMLEDDYTRQVGKRENIIENAGK